MTNILFYIDTLKSGGAEKVLENLVNAMDSRRFAVTVATAVLPFALAFAGGTMLYVISDEMIPETHHDNESGATYALLVGFCVMLISDVLLG